MPSLLPPPTTKQGIFWEVRVWRQWWSFYPVWSLQESHAGVSSFWSSVWLWYAFTHHTIHSLIDVTNPACSKLNFSPRMSSPLVLYLSQWLYGVLLYSAQKPEWLPLLTPCVLSVLSSQPWRLLPTSGHPALVCVIPYLYFCKSSLVGFPSPVSLRPPLPILCPALTLRSINHTSARRIPLKQFHQGTSLLQIFQRLPTVFRRKIKPLSTASKALPWFLNSSAFRLKFYTLRIIYSPNVSDSFKPPSLERATASDWNALLPDFLTLLSSLPDSSKMSGKCSLWP